MSYEFKGIVKNILDEKTFDSGFRVREFVLEDPEARYPQPIVFQVTQDGVSKLEGIKEGDSITVSFDIRGREYNGKYFVNLNAWRINLGDGGSQGRAPDPGSQAGDPTMDFEPASDDDDNLPF